MKERFNQTINSIIISSVLAFIIGLIMAVFPKISIETISMLVSAYIITQGIVLIYLDIKAAKYFIPFDGLLIGIVSILMGIILICKPEILPLVFAIVIGIWMISSSINNIKIGLTLSKTPLPWIQIVLLGFLDLIVGLIMIFNPFEATVSLTLFAGIMLMIYSVINIIDMIIIKKDIEKIIKALSSKIKEFTK